MIDELERLAKLWKDGVLTDDEFAAQKQRIFAAQDRARPAAVSGAAIASDPAPTDRTQPVADDPGFDALDVLLDDAVPFVRQVDERASSGPMSSLTGGDLQFDDLDALLAADAAPAQDVVDSDETPPQGGDDPQVDVLAALLAEAGLSAAPLEDEAAAAPIETALPPADDGLVFDELDAAIDADEPPAPTQAARPLPDPTLVDAEGDPLFDELTDAPAALSPEAEPAVASAAALAHDDGAAEADPAPMPAPGLPAPAPVAPPRKKVSPRAVAARLARQLLSRIPKRKLPQPVLLGLGAVALFSATMGLGVALALATKGEAETAEHGEEAAHGEDHAAEAAAEPVAENAVQAAMPPEDASLPQLSQDFDTVMRQCRSIAAVTELFGTALADARQVPLESLKLVANSGQVRTDMSAPERKSCLVEVELPTGPLQCKVDAVVRYPDGVVGAHVGARSRAVTCEGDPHFDEDSDPARAADAGPDGRPHA